LSNKLLNGVAQAHAHSPGATEVSDQLTVFPDKAMNRVRIVGRWPPD